jgi:hypothetical protein
MGWRGGIPEDYSDGIGLLQPLKEETLNNGELYRGTWLMGILKG